MSAASKRRPPRRPRRAAVVRTDEGFSLLEVVVALSMVALVMAALTTFFVSTMGAVRQQSGLQTAVHVASDRMEQLRATQSAAQIADGAQDVQRDGITYATRWEAVRCWQPTSPRGGDCTYDPPDEPASGSWADFVEVRVRVQWRDIRCASATCSYATSTLLSRAELEPLFRVGTAA